MNPNLRKVPSRVTGPNTLERGAMSGAFFESYVFSEIYKSYLNAGKEPPVFYYRDKDQKEIDLLLYQNGELSPIEIKKAASPGKTAVKNFDVLEPVTREGAFEGLESLKVEIGTGSVICMAVVEDDRKSMLLKHRFYKSRRF